MGSAAEGQGEGISPRMEGVGQTSPVGAPSHPPKPSPRLRGP